MILSKQERPALYPEGEYLSFLLRATELLGRSIDYGQTLQNVAKASVSTIADICIIDLGDLGETQLVAAAHRDPEKGIALKGAGRHLVSEPGRPLHPVCRALQSGKTYYAPDIDDRWIEEHASGAEHAEFMRAMEYTSMIVVPLISRIYGVSGALTLVTTSDGHAPFHEPAVEFAEGLGRVCSTNIGKARLYRDAHATATTFQEAALPKVLPATDRLRFSSYYRPAAETMMVGGDWYDAFLIPDGRIAVCVGDVSGHGLQAAALMASMRNALRTAIIMEPDIGRALDTVDYLMRTEYGNGQFCTALLAIFDPESMTLRFASAGHPGPKIWDATTGAISDPVKPGNVPLGFGDIAPRRVQPQSVRLNSGIAVFYTDGLIEWGRDAIRGDEELEQAILRRDVRDDPDPARAIVEAVLGNEDPGDDVAVLVAIFESPP